MSSQVEPPQELGALLEHWASLDNDAEAATVRARAARVVPRFSRVDAPRWAPARRLRCGVRTPLRASPGATTPLAASAASACPSCVSVVARARLLHRRA